MMKNKRGQLESTMLAIFLIFAIGVVVFVFGDLFYRLFEHLDVVNDNINMLNSTEIENTLGTVKDLYATSWDYVTIAVTIAILISLITLAFMTRISPVFYWLYIIFGIVVVIITSILSNVWTSLTTQSVYADAITRYPMTNFILGNGFVTMSFTLILVLVVIFIFGKGGGDAR